MNLPGPTELIIILLVVLLLFGSTRLPKLARSMGEASREFKKGVSEREGLEMGAEPEPKARAEEKREVDRDGDDKVTMSRAELDALLAEREAQARKSSPPPA